MPASCCKPDYDAVFDDRTARRELAAYRRDGPAGSTHRLIDAVTRRGVGGAAVLDIGGGVGVVGLELLRAGAATLTNVDASAPYLAAARRAAREDGVEDRITFHHGDFVELAADVVPADVVTLDRVVCCYGDWAVLIERSTARARRLYGLVYPNDRWWLRLGIGLSNVWCRISGQTYRGYVHPERAIEARVRAAGFERRFHHRGWVWQTVLYERAAPG